MSSSILKQGVATPPARHSNGTFYAIKGAVGTAKATYVVSSTDGVSWVVLATISTTHTPDWKGLCTLQGDTLYFVVPTEDSSAARLNFSGRYNITTDTLTIDATDTINVYELITNDAGTHTLLAYTPEYRSMGQGYTRAAYAIGSNGGAMSSHVFITTGLSDTYYSSCVWDGLDTMYCRTSDAQAKVVLSTDTLVISGVSVPSSSGVTKASRYTRDTNGDMYMMSAYSIYKLVTTSTSATAILIYTFTDTGYLYANGMVHHDVLTGIYHNCSEGVSVSNNQGYLGHNAWNGTVESGWQHVYRSSTGMAQSYGDGIVYFNTTTASDTNMQAYSWSPFLYEESFNVKVEGSIQFNNVYTFALGNSVDITSVIVMPSLSQLATLTTAPPARNISGDLILPPLTILSDIESFRVDRNLSGVFILPSLTALATLGLTQFAGTSLLQLNHKLEAFIFQQDSVKYVLRINNSLNIPMINFTISSFSDLEGVSNLNSRVTAPVGYYSKLSELIGLSVDIYMQVGLIERLLVSTILNDVSAPEEQKTITLYSSAINATPSGGAFIQDNTQIYERNINNQKSIRIIPNTNIRFGDTVEYGSQKALIIANKVTTFIGQDQRFTEVSS